MDKRSLLILAAGVVIGFFAGYWAGRGQPPPPSAPGHGPPPVGLTGPSGPPGMGSPRSDADTARLEGEARRLEELRTASPDDTGLLESLGNIYYDLRRYPEAIDRYERALRGQPDSLSIQVDLATSRFYNGDPDAALAGLERVLAVEPGHPQALYNQGIIRLHGAEDLAGAAESWRRLLATGTDRIDLRVVTQRLEVIDRMLAEERAAEPAAGSPGR